MDNDTKELQLRVSRIEQRLDSLISALNNPKLSDEKTAKKQQRTNAYIKSTPAPKKMAAPQESYTSGQCEAITKKGTRCSRKARSNGYCWQHGG